jgi:hypothetical protein
MRTHDGMYNRDAANMISVFLPVATNKKPLYDRGLLFFIGDPAGIRTQDPYIKSVMLYRLSYEIDPSRVGEFPLLLNLF